MSVVRTAEVVPQPWANGGGTTRELLSAADGRWRISLADVDRPGSFSSFPGQDRLLTLVAGEVLVLEVGGPDGPAESVVEPARPFAFSGDDEVAAALPEGPVRALNLIAERGHRLSATVLELSRTSVLPLAADQAAFVVQGRVAAGAEEAGALDLVMGPGEVRGRARVVVLTIASPDR
ncbi:HutD/Ves family protein [Nocardioides insulae]|uniref:HutD/Ves family protein n=1 Tax=Nocardioides insulae TaxID=394734 RepID=UPI00048C91BA|nr:HutD family protein [Nocardioides insulae]